MTYAVFKDNKFVKTLSNNDESLIQYQIDPDFMTYDIGVFNVDYKNYHWLLDINGDVKYFVKFAKGLEMKLGYFEYSFLTRLKYLFTGKLPHMKGLPCH